MARPLRIAYPHAFYHVTCRGNERRAIYRDDQDRLLFLDKLKASLEIYGVKLHAYVLMGNHFHFIVETPKANLSEFMRHFNIAYTGAYNRRHNRVGHLYQGRYKAVVVEKDSYLLELSRYVHLNPVRVNPHKQKMIREQLKYLERFPWSSLAGYVAAERRAPWVSYEEVLGHLGASRSRYRQFIEDAIMRGYETPWEELTGQVILGREGFLEKLKGKLDKAGARRERPSLRAIHALDPEVSLSAVTRYFKIGGVELKKKRTPYRDYRAVAMELMYRYSGISQAELGRRLGGLDYSAVSRERKRLRERMAVDRQLKGAVEKIESRLNQR